MKLHFSLIKTGFKQATWIFVEISPCLRQVQKTTRSTCFSLSYVE